jgi:hypothetical protein
MSQSVVRLCLIGSGGLGFLVVLGGYLIWAIIVARANRQDLPGIARAFRDWVWWQR